MNRKIRVEPEAEAELQEAAEWYESQEAGLGLLLLSQVAVAYQRILSGEHGAPVPEAGTAARRIGISKFPPWMIFIEHCGEAVVLAFAHVRRRPGYWRTRVRSL